MEEGRSSASHEPEPSADNLPHATSARKRLASSSLSELKEESVALEEAGTDVVPSLKKSKHAEALEGSSDVPSVHPFSQTQDTTHPSTAPSDVSESQPPPEDMETDQASALSNEEIIEEARAEEDIISIKEAIEEQQKELPSPEDEVPYEGDAIVDELSDKPNTMMELTDEPPKSEDVKEILQSTIESEDEREEGELMPEDSEQQDVFSGDVQNESTTGDGGEIGDEGADAAEVASPEIPAERSEEVDATEDIAEASDKHDGNNSDQRAPDSSQSPQRSAAFNNNDQAAPDSVQSPKKSAAAQEGSPAPLPQTSVSERRSPSPSSSTVVTETDTPAPARAGGRTISLTAKARENARLRQQSQQGRMTTTPTPPRGARGRAVGGRVILFFTSIDLSFFSVFFHE